MSTFKTQVDIYKHLMEGNKVRFRSWGDRSWYCHLDKGMLKLQDGSNANYDFNTPTNWEPYIEPKKRVSWYKVTAHVKGDKRPIESHILVKSEEDFLGYSDEVEDDYHWIKLEFVCEAEVVE